MKVTLINSGNRPIGILDIEVAYLLHTTGRRRTCTSVIEEAGDILFDTSFVPTVIKENDVLIQQLRVTGEKMINDGRFIKKGEQGREIPLPEKLATPFFDIEVCLSIRLASPGLASVTKEFSVNEYTLAERGYKPKAHVRDRSGGAILIHKYEETILSK